MFCLKFFLLFLFSVFISSSACNVTVQYNPGCNITSCSNTSNLSLHLIYAKSQEENSSLHYVISTIGPSVPTILILRSNHSLAKIFIDWNKLLSTSSGNTLQGSIKLVDENGHKYKNGAETALYFFTELIGYSDISNTVTIHDPKAILEGSLYLDNLVWNVQFDNRTATFEGSCYNSSLCNNNSKFGLRFEFYNSSGRGSDLPRLGFNDQSAKVEVILSNFTSNFNSPRYALYVQVANPGFSSYQKDFNQSEFVDYIVRKTIDDEYAPAVFTTTNLLWKGNSSPTALGRFWLWRTVCYTRPFHERKYSTDVMSSSLTENSYANSSQVVTTNRLLLSYFGESLLTKIKFNSTLLRFGNPDDGFYNSTNYISWTTLIGFGTPPSDPFSLMVICILLAGVACPLLVIIVSGIYYIAHKRKHRNKGNPVSKSAYEPLA